MKLSIPKDGDHSRPGYIRDKNTTKILILLKDESNKKGKIVLQDLNKDVFLCQKWHKSKTNEDGWFAVLDESKSEFLTRESEDQVTTSEIGKMIYVDDIPLDEYIETNIPNKTNYLKNKFIHITICLMTA